MMEEKHELLIHIGTMKTGTTALQRFFVENGDIIHEHGWYYPDLCNEIADFNFEAYETSNDKKIWARYINARVLRMFFEGNKKLSALERDKLWKEMWKTLYTYLDKGNVILSDERLWWGASSELYRKIKDQYNHIKIVVYLRRQDRYIESYWNQRVKRLSSFSEDFQEALVRGRLNCSYLERLKELENIFGIENIIVRSYEREQFRGERKDVVSDFLSLLNVYPDWNKCIASASENESLSGNMLEIKRHLNRALTEGDPASEKINDLFHEISANKNKDKITHIQGYFSESERKRFLESVSSENEEIARRYMKRQDGILFYDMNTNIAEHTIDSKNMYGDIIRTFGEYVRNLQEQNLLLQDEIKKLYSKMSSSIYDKE